MEKKWDILKPDPELVKRLASDLNCLPSTASVLVNRGIDSSKAARIFINAGLKNIRPPFAIRDMDTAVRRIYSAIINNEKVLIFGDYDVDGITASAIVYEFLQACGADATCYIPHRIKEGYSLQSAHIDNVARPAGVVLIITVDCGSTSHDAVLAANTAGIDVVITDHHEICDPIPEAIAVVNPKRSNCKAGFEHLAGVGVAFYLLICLRKYLREMNFKPGRPQINLKNYCDLVALGTIADMVPLVAENRIFAKAGLAILENNPRPGLQALLQISKTHSDVITSEDVAFRLAPRLNAAGRIAHALTAFKLLTTADHPTAFKTAELLNHLNARRQTIEKDMFQQICNHIDDTPALLDKKALVFTDPRWHEGILGIVASQLARKYFRPVVLISTRSGMGKGSGRSIPGFDLYQGLQCCKKHLENYGGHSMAAGLKIEPANIDKFNDALIQAVEKQTPASGFRPQIAVDARIDFTAITGNLADEIETLMPFGEGNPEPLFMTTNIKILSSSTVGQHHCRMRLMQTTDKQRRTLSAIVFNMNAQEVKASECTEIIFRLHWNRWQNTRSLQLVIEAIR
jgi:single-stranded-DNA-specific exonuclease